MASVMNLRSALLPLPPCAQEVVDSATAVAVAAIAINFDVMSLAPTVE
jgi:hypothetical protein